MIHNLSCQKQINLKTVFLHALKTELFAVLEPRKKLVVVKFELSRSGHFHKIIQILGPDGAILLERRPSFVLFTWVIIRELNNILIPKRM